MDIYKHHQRVWKLLYFILKPVIKHKFNPDFEEIKTDGPIILITNHCTTWDPLLLAMALKKKQIYYVASEHIFRLGLASKAIIWLVGPIARKKGASAGDTTSKCLEHLHAGHSVCIFGEGEQSWDGLSKTVIRGTGKLVKDSGATLVTYRMIGGFLSLPRWADKVRKGSIKGEVAGIYAPEELKDKTPEEINEIMNRDIYVDMWQYQKEHKVIYRSEAMAEHLERMLYLCPKCLSTTGLKSSGKHLSCECGLDLTVNEYGFFEPAEPFEDLAEWEKWQKQNLRDLNFRKVSDDILFRQDDSTLKEIYGNHEVKEIASGPLSLSSEELICADRHFPLKDIRRMAMTRFGVLLFTYDDHYYQIKIEGEVNLRKYLEIWKKINNKE